METSAGLGEALDGLLDGEHLAAAIKTENFRRFLDRLPIAIVISKQLGNAPRIVYANTAFERLSGLPLDRVLYKTWSVCDIFRGEDDPEQSLAKAVLDQDDYLGAFRRPVEDGQSRLVEASVTVVEDEEGDASFRLLAMADLSDRERSLREAFARQLRDKDLLLKELQHRVKNSLQIITALIRLEARNAREGKAVNFDGVAGRIEALSILYRALSESPSGQTLDLGNYLSQIASALLRSHASDNIRFDLKVETCPVSINIAMPVGLILNEVMTNALKHAFIGRESGALTLHCLREDEMCRVLIADDGVGLPPGTVWPPEGKISALIAQSLHENAKAELHLESSPGRGTRVSFAVPLSSALSSVAGLPAHGMDGAGDGAALAG